MSKLEIVACLQCGSLAEVVGRFVFQSTDGPIEHISTRCVGQEGVPGEARHMLTFDVARLAVAQTAPDTIDQSLRFRPSGSEELLS